MVAWLVPPQCTPAQRSGSCGTPSRMQRGCSPSSIQSRAMSTSQRLPEYWCIVIKFSSRKLMKSIWNRSRAYFTRSTT